MKKSLNFVVITFLSACSSNNVEVSEIKFNEAIHSYASKVSSFRINDAMRVVGFDPNNSNMRGIDGTGVKVGVVENSIFMKNDPEMKGRYETGIDEKGKAFDGDTGTCSYKKTNGDCAGDHATMVSTVVASKSFGLAPGVKIVPYRTANIGGYNKPIKGLYDTYQDAKKKGLVALNASWGSATADNEKENYIKAVIRSNFGSSLIAQMSVDSDRLDKDASDKAKNNPIWVFASGNEQQRRYLPTDTKNLERLKKLQAERKAEEEKFKKIEKAKREAERKKKEAEKEAKLVEDLKKDREVREERAKKIKLEKESLAQIEAERKNIEERAKKIEAERKRLLSLKVGKRFARRIVAERKRLEVVRKQIEVAKKKNEEKRKQIEAGRQARLEKERLEKERKERLVKIEEEKRKKAEADRLAKLDKKKREEEKRRKEELKKPNYDWWQQQADGTWKAPLNWRASWKDWDKLKESKKYKDWLVEFEKVNVSNIAANKRNMDKLRIYYNSKKYFNWVKEVREIYVENVKIEDENNKKRIIYQQKLLRYNLGDKTEIKKPKKPDYKSIKSLPKQPAKPKMEAYKKLPKQPRPTPPAQPGKDSRYWAKKKDGTWVPDEYSRKYLGKKEGDKPGWFVTGGKYCPVGMICSFNAESEKIIKEYKLSYGKQTDGGRPSHQSHIGKLFPKLQRFVLVSTGVRADGRRIYNKCGDAKQYCLGALADLVQTRNKYGSNIRSNGTSFAAPAVTAGIALVRQKFGTGYSTQEIRQRLLQTARHELANGTKLKDSYGNEIVPVEEYVPDYIAGKNADGTQKTYKHKLSEHFGHGVMRLDLALNPVGLLNTAFGKSLNFAKLTPAYKSYVKPSPVFGSGLKTAFSKHTTTTYDSLNAPFKSNMGTVVRSQESNNAKLENNFNTMVSLDKTTSYGFGANNKNIKDMNFNFVGGSSIPNLLGQRFNYHFNVGDNLLTGTYFSTKGDMILNTTAYSYKGKNYELTPTLNILYENGRVLGAEGSGVYKTNTISTSTFIGSGFKTKLSGINFYSFFNYGKTISRGTFSDSIKNVNDLYSREYGFYANYDLDSISKFGIGFVAPLVVEKGSMDIYYNVGRDYDRNLKFKNATLNIAPTGRQQNIEMFYATNNEYFDTRLMTLYIKDKDHTRGVNDLFVGIKLSTQF